MILPLIPSVIFINLFYSTTISALPHLLPRQTDQTVQQYLDTAMQFVSEPQTGISSPNSQVTTPEPQKTDIFDVPASGVEGVTKHLLNNILLCEDRSVVPPRQFTCPPGVAPGTTFPADPNSPGTPLNSPDNNNSDNNWSAGSSVPTTNGNWRA